MSYKTRQPYREKTKNKKQQNDNKKKCFLLVGLICFWFRSQKGPSKCQSDKSAPTGAERKSWEGAGHGKLGRAMPVLPSIYAKLQLLKSKYRARVCWADTEELLVKMKAH